MATVLSTARRQINDLLDYYLEHDRGEAAERLIDAVRQAVRGIDQNLLRPAPYPRPYRGVRAHGLSWVKVHRCWFGYTVMADGTTGIVNVLWESSDIPSRAERFDSIQ